MASPFTTRRHLLLPASTFYVSWILIDLDVMVATSTVRRAGVLALVASIVVAFAACGGNDDDAEDATGSSSGASTAFVPGSAPPMPPLPPGAGPHGPNPNPQPTSMPTNDAAPPNDATAADAPADATGE